MLTVLSTVLVGKGYTTADQQIIFGVLILLVVPATAVTRGCVTVCEGYVRLEGKLIIATGAAGGIGAASAAVLRAAGADVVACYVTPGAERHLDVADPECWQELVALLDRVDGLLNAAGVTHRARLPELQGEDFARVMSINALGPMYGMQAVLPLMPSGGSIVNICSLAALTGHYTAAYTASKWALRGSRAWRARNWARAEFASTRCFPATSRPR